MVVVVVIAEWILLLSRTGAPRLDLRNGDGRNMLRRRFDDRILPISVVFRSGVRFTNLSCIESNLDSFRGVVLSVVTIDLRLFFDGVFVTSCNGEGMTGADNRRLPILLRLLDVDMAH